MDQPEQPISMHAFKRITAACLRSEVKCRQKAKADGKRWGGPRALAHTRPTYTLLRSTKRPQNELSTLTSPGQQSNKANRHRESQQQQQQHNTTQQQQQQQQQQIINNNKSSTTITQLQINKTNKITHTLAHTQHKLEKYAPNQTPNNTLQPTNQIYFIYQPPRSSASQRPPARIRGKPHTQTRSPVTRGKRLQPNRTEIPLSAT
uniref:Uncharacterized protein n=1 Tax=Rhodnius prolixus TaxID=13249 RepID=T1HK05_RHOPR